MKPTASRNKGRNFEKLVTSILCSVFGIDESNITRSGIFGGEDIKFAKEVQKTNTIGQFSIECKKVEKLKIWDAIEQCIKNSKGKIPLVVFSKNHEDIYATIPFDVFLDMCNIIDCSAYKENNPNLKNLTYGEFKK